MGYLTDGVTFNGLREANTMRLPLFRNKHGEISHSQEDGADWSPAEWLEAVVGELGEYANLAKKYRRGDLSEEEFLKEAADELADVVIYLDILAYQWRINLGRAVESKFNRTSEKVDAPVRLDAEGGHYMEDTG